MWNTRNNRFLVFPALVGGEGFPSLSAKQLAKSASKFLSAFRLLPRLEEVYIRRVYTPAATLRRSASPDGPKRGRLVVVCACCCCFVFFATGGRCLLPFGRNVLRIKTRELRNCHYGATSGGTPRSPSPSPPRAGGAAEENERTLKEWPAAFFFKIIFQLIFPPTVLASCALCEKEREAIVRRRAVGRPPYTPTPLFGSCVVRGLHCLQCGRPEERSGLLVS